MEYQKNLAIDGKRPYAKPQINVVEINGADIICGSTGTTEDYGDGDTTGWY